MIRAGQVLMQIDLDAIRKAGLSTETPVVITNGKTFESMHDQEVKCCDQMLRLA